MTSAAHLRIPRAVLLSQAGEVGFQDGAVLGVGDLGRFGPGEGDMPSRLGRIAGDQVGTAIAS